jgi:hypothetical protein
VQWGERRKTRAEMRMRSAYATSCMGTDSDAVYVNMLRMFEYTAWPAVASYMLGYL